MQQSVLLALQIVPILFSKALFVKWVCHECACFFSHTGCVKAFSYEGLNSFSSLGLIMWCSLQVEFVYICQRDESPFVRHLLCFFSLSSVPTSAFFLCFFYGIRWSDHNNFVYEYVNNTLTLVQIWHNKTRAMSYLSFHAIFYWSENTSCWVSFDFRCTQDSLYWWCKAPKFVPTTWKTSYEISRVTYYK